MATQTVHFGAGAGVTGTQLFSPTNDTVISSSGIPSRNIDSGRWTAEYSNVPAGTYVLVAKNASGIVVAEWYVDLLLATGDYAVYEKTGGGGSGALDVTVAVPSAVAAAAEDPELTVVYRGTKWAITLADVGDLTGHELHFCVKKGDESDSDSILHATASDGLLTLNGGTGVTAGDASITVVDGDATAIVKPAATAKIRPGLYWVGFKKVGVASTQLSKGHLRVDADLPREHS